MDGAKNVEFNEESVNKPNMVNDEKSDVLETPKIDSFKHENNVFGLAFKQQTLMRLNSINGQPEIDTPIPDLLANPLAESNQNLAPLTSTLTGPVTSFLSLSSQPNNTAANPNIINSNNVINITNNPNSTTSPLINRPAKKTLLLRAISQNDNPDGNQIKPESNKYPTSSNVIEKTTPSIDDDKKSFNVPFIDQLENREKSSTGESLTSNTTYNITGQTANTFEMITNTSMPKEIASVELLNNHYVNEALNNRNLKGNIGVETNLSSLLNTINDTDSNTNVNNNNNNNNQMNVGKKSNRSSKNNSKSLNIAEKMKYINKSSTFSESSLDFIKSDSLRSSLSTDSSSNEDDEMVTSSDQHQTKQKKRRLMELNSEERKLQIRSSNREAARRCRERRRNYIVFLESNIQNLEAKIKELTNENSTLKKFYQEHKSCTNSNPNIGAHVNDQSLNQLKTTPKLMALKESPNDIREIKNQQPVIALANLASAQALISTTISPNYGNTLNEYNNNHHHHQSSNLMVNNHSKNPSMASNASSNNQLIQLLEETLAKQSK